MDHIIPFRRPRPVIRNRSVNEKRIDLVYDDASALRELHRFADLAGTLEAAFGEDGPSLVVIPIDYRENPLLTKKLGEITCTI